MSGKQWISSIKCRASNEQRRNGTVGCVNLPVNDSKYLNYGEWDKNFLPSARSESHESLGNAHRYFYAKSENTHAFIDFVYLKRGEC